MNRETPCRWPEFKPGTSRCSDPGLLHNHFDFFSLFFPCCRLIHPYRLVNNLRSDIIGYKFRTSGRTVWRGFSLCPIIPYRSGFAKLSRQLDQASGRFRSRHRFADLIQEQSKSRGSMHSRCSALPFSLSLILPIRRTLNLRRIALRALPAGPCVALRAPRVSLQLRVSSCRSCMPCRCHAHVFTAQLIAICGLAQPSKSFSRNMVVTACNNSGVAPLTLLVLRLDQSSLGSSTPCCVIASQPVLSCLTVFRRLLCPINHHLVD